jgi:hypothetical protein
LEDTTLPFTAMSKEPEGPTRSSASTPSASFSAAAARTALGWYPQELQYEMVIMSALLGL